MLNAYNYGYKDVEIISTTLTPSLRVQHLLGKGEKGDVYLVKDAEGHLFALKIFYSAQELVAKGFPRSLIPFYFDPEGYSRLSQREYRIGADLNLPAFVKVYRCLIWQGKSAVVMEAIEGKVLSDMAPLSLQIDVVKPLLRTAIEGLIFALEKGYVSSDLYQGNAMVDAEGSFKFIDLDSFNPIEEGIDRAVEETFNGYRWFLEGLFEKALNADLMRLRFEQISSEYWEKIILVGPVNLAPEHLPLLVEYLYCVLEALEG